MLTETYLLMILTGLIFTTLSILRNSKEESAIFSAMAGIVFFITALGAVNLEKRFCCCSDTEMICQTDTLPTEHNLAMVWVGLGLLNIFFMYLALTSQFGGSFNNTRI